MFEYAELLPVGFYTFGANANTTNVPDSPSAGCIIKRTSSHISIILVAYGTGKYYCVEYGGNWRKWNKLVLDSDLGYTDVTMDTVRGSNNYVPNITGMNYIPVVLRVSSDYTGVSVYGNRGANSWLVISPTEQNMTIRFYKYPA